MAYSNKHLFLIHRPDSWQGLCWPQQEPTGISAKTLLGCKLQVSFQSAVHGPSIKDCRKSLFQGKCRSAIGVGDKRHFLTSWFIFSYISWGNPSHMTRSKTNQVSDMYSICSTGKLQPKELHSEGFRCVILSPPGRDKELGTVTQMNTVVNI